MSFSSSDPSNRPIVDGIFQEIARRLWPIVNKRMTDHDGAHWADSKNRNIEGDLSAIVGVILGNWESCFSDSMHSYERTFAHEIRDWGNTFAHNSNAVFPNDDVLRICDTAERLFKNISPNSSEKFKELASELSSSSYDSRPSPAFTTSTTSETQRSTTDRSDSLDRQTLTDSIRDYLIENPGASARRIAAGTKAVKMDVNSILYARPDLFVKDTNSTPGWTAL